MICSVASSVTRRPATFTVGPRAAPAARWPADRRRDTARTSSPRAYSDATSASIAASARVRRRPRRRTSRPRSTADRARRHVMATGAASMPVVSGSPSMRFIDCTACPAPPLTRLSSALVTTSWRAVVGVERAEGPRQVGPHAAFDGDDLGLRLASAEHAHERRALVGARDTAARPAGRRSSCGSSTKVFAKMPRASGADTGTNASEKFGVWPPPRWRGAASARSPACAGDRAPCRS